MATTNVQARTLWIGILQGEWKEMGIQYGKRAGKDVAWGFDLLWSGQTGSGIRLKKQLWQKQGRTVEENEDYAVAYMQRMYKELEFLSPEIHAFFEGIGLGAAEELEKCVWHHRCPNHSLKIALLNLVDMHFHPNWDFANDRPYTTTLHVKADSADDCNAFWVKGEATKTGETYATRHIQGGGVSRGRSVAYVAIPEDRNASVFWGTGRAGSIGGLGGGLLNEYGVCGLTAGCQPEEPDVPVDEALAPGVKDFWLASYGVIFSKNAREAVDRITVGTERYRQLTGRKTVLRARGCTIIFGDPNEAFDVEQNARHYAIRKPGDLGEIGGNYLVIANHFKDVKGSYDENNVFQKDITMGGTYTPERKGDSSYYRFWQGMWNLRNNYGEIDLDMMKELTSSHTSYDEEGKRYDPDPVTGMPATGTWCAHKGPFSKEQPLGVDGSNCVSVFNLSTREVYWVPVWPCHYKEWNMDWHYLDLKPYVKYRKNLWGY